jgi:hypothetical protein
LRLDRRRAIRLGSRPGENQLRRIAIAITLLVLSLALGASPAAARPPHGGHGGRHAKKCKKGYVSKRGHCVKPRERGIQSGTYGDESVLFEVDAARGSLAFYFGGQNCGAGVSASGPSGSRTTAPLPKIGKTFSLSGSYATPGYGSEQVVAWEVSGRFTGFNAMKVALHYTTTLKPTSPGGASASCEQTLPDLTFFVAAQ